MTAAISATISWPVVGQWAGAPEAPPEAPPEYDFFETRLSI